MQPTPINVAETILDAFWDPGLSGLKQWQVDDGGAHGLRVYQNWCWVACEWARRPLGPVLTMRRRFDMDCARYDQLVLSVVLPREATLTLSATTDAGERRLACPRGDGRKHESALPLAGARRLLVVELALAAGAEGEGNGWFNWLGLQRSALLAAHRAQFPAPDPEWADYLKPASFTPTFTPTVGLLVNGAELTALRAEHEAWLKAHGESPYTKAAAAAAKYRPEELVGEFVNFWGDTRYNRERDEDRPLIDSGVAAALAGILTRDATLLRLGARYALALALTRHWDDGMICRFPGGTFEHRCFVQSLCALDVALILDLAGELFTYYGREFLRRRLAEEGLGAIAFNTWKHEYIFGCNQLAWFAPGRMAASLMLERDWPRVRPYTEIGLAELQESLEKTVMPDGGYAEGPTYFTCVGGRGGSALYYYARARGLDFAAVAPPAMRRTAAFAEAYASTDPAQDVIAVCDSGNRMDATTLAVMAALLPESAWLRLFRGSLARSGQLPATLIAWQLAQRLPAAGPAPQAFVHLPVMGTLASTRRHGAHWVKLLVPGNRAQAGHAHEDKGSFVLEYAGETFAMDPGTGPYGDPLAGEYKHAQRHNMLVPVSGLGERPQPANPIPVDVYPTGQGDAQCFRARVDATPGWERSYRRWVRTWESPTPDVLVIHDEYELFAGDGVDFLWQTRLPVRLAGQTATLAGRAGEAVLTFPAGVALRVEELPAMGDARHWRVSARQTGRQGTITVRVQLR